MKIAYVSFEYPPDTAVGGIATYVHQVARMMHSRGHQIEVFCASPYREGSEKIDGILVHRILTEDTLKFPKEVLPIFVARHKQIHFDILESPEYNGDGYEIKKNFPALPLVVKLHTPAKFIRRLDNFYSIERINLFNRTKYIMMGLIKRESRPRYWEKWIWQDRGDIDHLITALADQIHTPSVSLGDIVAKNWKIERPKILHVPYPFIPNESFLQIPIVKSQTNIITFIGRLEIRKGLTELTKAIQLVCNAVPDVKFRFIGRTLRSIIPGLTMQEYIESELSAYKTRLEFLHMKPEQIPEALAQTDVCVFPSIWENFPNVCLEAMSAGRAIVGSNQGGMQDMLRSPKAGLLVDPLNPKEIAKAIIYLLHDQDLKVALGEAARQKVLSEYNSEKIGLLMEQKYNEAINKAKSTK